MMKHILKLFLGLTAVIGILYVAMSVIERKVRKEELADLY